MKVTVYLVTFNRKILLERAIFSVINQTYKNIELIVIDDNSQDGTKEYLESNYDEYNKLIDFKFYVNSENRGACFSRNKAIKNASGELITGLDDDDQFMPFHINNLINNYNIKYSFIAASYKEDDGYNSCIRDNNTGIIDLNLLLHFNVIGNQILTQTNFLKEIGGFDESLTAFQDYDTWIRLVLKYGPGIKLKKASYIVYSGHSQNRISEQYQKRLLAFDIFLAKHRHEMSQLHLNSSFLLRKKIENKKLRLCELIKRINIFNFKLALSLYVNSTIPFIGKAWRILKK